MSENPIVPTEIRIIFQGRVFSVRVETIPLPKGGELQAEIIRHLKASFAYQRSVLEKSDAAFKTGKVMSFGKEVTANHVFIDMIADQHEHLGQLIAYARVNGIVPPWSKGM